MIATIAATAPIAGRRQRPCDSHAARQIAASGSAAKNIAYGAAPSGCRVIDPRCSTAGRGMMKKQHSAAITIGSRRRRMAITSPTASRISIGGSKVARRPLASTSSRSPSHVYARRNVPACSPISRAFPRMPADLNSCDRVTPTLE